MRLYFLASLVMMCLSLTACTDKFYIPIWNEKGTAKPLSKTDDVIRVVVPDRLKNYVEKTRAAEDDWEKNAKLAAYIMTAKLDTEERLQALGYQLTDTGFSSNDIGKPKKIDWIDDQGNTQYAMTHGGKPTVFALVDSRLVNTYTQRFISNEPYSSDPGTGATTMWTNHVDEVTMNKVAIGIKLVRPIGKDNPLYQCNNSSLSADLCIFPDSYWLDTSHYETIFYGVGTMTTSARDPDYIENHLTSSILYQYPNLLGKKRVIQISQPFFQVTKITDDK
ncbi:MULTISPECIES: hypothetical protein [unclassified Commensalibacter]|uniref:hypothetical protein n=1 Tax=unclassified Commensalibacter TaxID=2630218 RepID=UPI0018DC6FE4|nr:MULTISPECIES: hypothetical protein [unclassified Commensalibacter]MBI0017709.1 hypothetical protein [Commensalibacter sp. B14384M2]MBI0050605.1 hypothetical protein [Commensalibacter sp. B14384M3]MBI0180317.1 hypothetical protein [Commensalibacter sp. W8163]